MHIKAVLQKVMLSSYDKVNNALNLIRLIRFNRLIKIDFYIYIVF